jgi:hypothetical protein
VKHAPFLVTPMIAEIPISAATLAGTLANVRSWLDHNHCEPVRSDTKSGGTGHGCDPRRV